MTHAKIKTISVVSTASCVVLEIGLGITGFESQLVGWLLVAIGGTGLAVCFGMLCQEAAGWLKERYPNLRLPQWAYAYRRFNRATLIAFAVILPGYVVLVVSIWYPDIETYGKAYIVVILMGTPVLWVALRLRDWIIRKRSNGDVYG